MLDLSEIDSLNRLPAHRLPITLWGYHQLFPKYAPAHFEWHRAFERRCQLLQRALEPFDLAKLQGTARRPR